MRATNRSLFKPRTRGNYKIENKAEEATVYLYDEISWLGISAEQFVKDLNNLKAGTIHLRVNSPGGSVFDGTAIFNAIKQHKSRVVAHIDGLAASIASVIVMAADEVRMAENAFLMIHDPWSIVIGNAQDMRDEADLLERVGGTIAKSFTDKSGKEESEILDLMAAETWFTAQEALDAGFVDSISAEKKEKAQAVLFDLSVFANVPESLLERKSAPTARDAEKALRDVGFSQCRAKAILAEGFSDNQRDVDSPDLDPPPEVQRDAAPPRLNDPTFALLLKGEKFLLSKPMEASNEDDK